MYRAVFTWSVVTQDTCCEIRSHPLPELLRALHTIMLIIIMLIMFIMVDDVATKFYKDVAIANWVPIGAHRIPLR
jgi:hypothetical protein